jgi:hypothetical protein
MSRALSHRTKDILSRLGLGLSTPRHHLHAMLIEVGCALTGELNLGVSYNINTRETGVVRQGTRDTANQAPIVELPRRAALMIALSSA